MALIGAVVVLLPSSDGEFPGFPLLLLLLRFVPPSWQGFPYVVDIPLDSERFSLSPLPNTNASRTLLRTDNPG